MDWKDKIQLAFYAAGAIFSLFSIYSIYQARRQYRRSLRQRTAQSLLELEERWGELKDILPLVDPESGRYEEELQPAVEKSLQQAPTSERSHHEKAKIVSLDRFLRFLLLLTAVQEYELLKPEALRFMYWYWFKAISENPHLRSYVDRYFPTLEAALEKDPITVQPDDSYKKFIKEVVINASPERVFEFHEDRDVLRKLIPPWIKVEEIKTGDISELGSKTILDLRLLGIKKIRWEAQHISYKPKQTFTDIQIKGPFRRWHHCHTVLQDQGVTKLIDEIDYQLPFGWFGRLLNPLIERRLNRLFEYRHEITRRECEERGPENPGSN